jgi:branched-chain amino acid transport system ATP-binding protein
LTATAAHDAGTASPATEPLLAARGVFKRFGALQVLEDVTLEVQRGRAVGIVGPNGAGKTTLLDLIAGATRAEEGAVFLGGRDVSSLSAAARCRLGIGRTHQIPRPFSGMTVFENALVAASMGARLRGSEAQDKALGALELMDMVGLGNRRADSLGLLDRKRLELARALATAPELLLLDEIAGGLTEPETLELVEHINQLHSDGLTIVWIEHVVHALLRVAERLVCLAAGRVIADGEPQSVMNDQAVIDAYLGSAA